MAYSLAQKLIEVKARVARRRCEAFVDYAPTVCGIRLRPITLASYNQLVAFENPFVYGEAASDEAIAAFVWVQHPDFAQDASDARRRVMRQIVRALYPRFPRINSLVALFSTAPRLRWLRRFIVPTREQRLAAAVAEIRRLIIEATHDIPTPSRDDEESEKRSPDAPPVALMAQLLNMMKRTLDLPHDVTESMPLKRAVQLLREQIHHSTGGKGIGLMHREEAAVWAEHIAQKTAAAARA